MTAYHRDQSREGAWAARYGCTAVATLVGMALATDGDTGPAITADQFRARQGDQDGGIDLVDARRAAAFYGVTLVVHADYGMDHRPFRWSEFVAAGNDHEIMIVQGDHGSLPARLRCDDFRGDHAIATSGRNPTSGTWRVSNPLCDDWLTWPDDAMRAYTFGLAGTDRVFAAVVGRNEKPVRDWTIIPGAKSGTIRINPGAPHYYLLLRDDTINGPFDDDWHASPAFGPVKLTDTIDHHAGGDDRKIGYLWAGTGSAFVLAKDVTFTPDTADPDAIRKAVQTYREMAAGSLVAMLLPSVP